MDRHLVMNKFLSYLAITTIAITSHAAQKITITGNDTMQFDKREFTVKSGEKVELEFKNIGKLPKIAMGHNLVILKKGISSLKFGQKVMSLGASATNALPDGSMNSDSVQRLTLFASSLRYSAISSVDIIFP